MTATACPFVRSAAAASFWMSTGLPSRVWTASTVTRLVPVTLRASVGPKRPSVPRVLTVTVSLSALSTVPWAVATATDTLDRTQPPEDPSLEATVTEAGDVLDEAGEAVQTAREHLVAGADAATVEDDIARLDDVQAALADLIAGLP